MLYLLLCLVALCIGLVALWRLATVKRNELAKELAAERARAVQVRRQARDLSEALEHHQAAFRRAATAEQAAVVAAATAAAQLTPDGDDVDAAAAAINRVWELR